MGFYIDLEKRKILIREYIRRNPHATFKEIKINLHTKINKVYKRSMVEAYQDANVEPPRNFKRLSKRDKRKILIDFVKSYPQAGGHTIRKETKINFLTIFKSTQELFEAASVPYVKKNIALYRGKDAERKSLLTNLIKKNPHIGVTELMNSSKVNIYHHFNDIHELYHKAGLPYLGKGIRRKLKKQEQVIRFIRKNVLATQREVNRFCKTHVQTLFEGGIFEAYKKANVPFPFERLNVHGAALREIRDKASSFENEIAIALLGYGGVSRLVKTKRGFADIILERKNRKVIIEIKNYESHEISSSDLKQLNRYLEDANLRLGFLVCLKKPKRDTFLIGRNRVIVLDKSDLFKIPDLIDKGP